MEDVVELQLQDKISVPLSMAFPKDSQIEPVVSFFILKLRETGLLDKMRQDWSLGGDRQRNHWEEIQESGTVLGFENLSFPFLVLGFGIATSFVLSLLEKGAYCIVNLEKNWYAEQSKKTSQHSRHDTMAPGLNLHDRRLAGRI